MICKANYCTGSHQILPASMTRRCWIGTAWCLLQQKYVFIHMVDKLSVACITNKTFQLNKIGPDDMQSHPCTAFWPIPDLTSHAEVPERWGLLSHAQNTNHHYNHTNIDH